MFLNEIVKRKKEVVGAVKNKKYLADLKSRIFRNPESPDVRSFQETLSRKVFPGQTGIHLIAEIKKASPSKGVIREDFNPAEISRLYEESGASAISVLTEEFFFQGSLKILEEVRNQVRLPLLRKDFIIDEIQLYESRAFGSDAVLLIAAILEPGQIRDYFLLAGELGLDVLVEVHSEKELEKIVEWAPVIGINNRDLTTFEVDLSTTQRLLKYIPPGKVIVSESGISRKEDLLPLIEQKVNAVLIGEAFMREKDIQEAVQKLFPKARGEHGEG